MIEKIYTENYSSGIPNSPKVLEHLKTIIDGAILKENIENQCVIEIGASDFTFSELLLERGASKVIAFEPSALPYLW
jgi:predicted rRNA methylase YqxC with S4 and FtsJ domains